MNWIIDYPIKFCLLYFNFTLYHKKYFWILFCKFFLITWNLIQINSTVFLQRKMNYSKLVISQKWDISFCLDLVWCYGTISCNLNNRNCGQKCLFLAFFGFFIGYSAWSNHFFPSLDWRKCSYSKLCSSIQNP